MNGFRVWSNYWKRYATEAELYMDGSVDAVFEDDDGVPHHDNTDLAVEFKTGLKDKNGKEIYEGDIVGSDDGSRYLTGAVEWNEDYAKYEVIYSQLTGNSFEFEGDDGYPVANLCEVIGNIHENQDLLGDTNVIDKEEE